jgi:hypothetical protein
MPLRPRGLPVAFRSVGALRAKLGVDMGDPRRETSVWLSGLVTNITIDDYLNIINI